MTVSPEIKARLAAVAHFALCAIAGALLFYIAEPSPAPDRTYATLHVSRAEFEKHEPTAKPSTLSKIVRPVAKLEQRATADGAGKEMLDAFVRAATDTGSNTIISDQASKDSVGNVKQPAAPLSDSGKLLNRPTSPNRLAYVYGWEYTRSHLDLFTFTSDAAKERLSYNVCGHVTGRMVGDSAVMQGSRLCWLGGFALAGGVGAIGYGIGARNPYVAGIGLAVLGVRMLLRKRPP